MHTPTSCLLAASAFALLLGSCSPQDRRPPGPRQCKATLVHADPGGAREVQGELVQGDDSWVILKIGDDRYRWIPRENVCYLELDQAQKKE